MTSKILRKRNMKRWGLVHALAMQALGWERNDCEHFYQIGMFIADWTDIAGKLPKTRDFLACKAIIETLPHA